jgi:hypothetical protein
VPDTKEHKRKETVKNRLSGMMNDREGEDLIGIRMNERNGEDLTGRNGKGKRRIRKTAR